jgi:hypothetical protein
MPRLAATQIMSFPLRGVVPESVEALRATCAAAEDAASVAIVPDSPAYAELLRTREIFQQLLDAMSLEMVQLKRELQARDRLVRAVPAPLAPSSAVPQALVRRFDDEIRLDEIDAVLARTPLED